MAETLETYLSTIKHPRIPRLEKFSKHSDYLILMMKAVDETPELLDAFKKVVASSVDGFMSRSFNVAKELTALKSGIASKPIFWKKLQGLDRRMFEAVNPNDVPDSAQNTAAATLMAGILGEFEVSNSSFNKYLDSESLKKEIADYGTERGKQKFATMMGNKGYKESGGDLENSEKILTFTQDTTKNGLQDILSGISGVTKGAAIQAAAGFLRRNAGAGSMVEISKRPKEDGGTLSGEPGSIDLFDVIGHEIVKIEEPTESGQAALQLILTTDKGVKVFEWMPRDRHKDLFINPKGDSDEQIKMRWKDYSNGIVYINSPVAGMGMGGGKKQTLSYTGVISFKNYEVICGNSFYLVSVDGKPKYCIFGFTQSVGKAKIKDDVLEIKGALRRRQAMHFKLHLVTGKLELVGSLEEGGEVENESVEFSVGDKVTIKDNVSELFKPKTKGDVLMLKLLQEYINQVGEVGRLFPDQGMVLVKYAKSHDNPEIPTTMAIEKEYLDNLSKHEAGGKVKKDATPQIIFQLKGIGYKGATPELKFSFHAKDMEDAISKAKDWGHYHSLSYGSDYLVEDYKEGEPVWLHDEYVKFEDGGEVKPKLDWYDIISFDVAEHGEDGAKAKADKYIEEHIAYHKGKVSADELKTRFIRHGGKDYKGEWSVQRLLPVYAEGGKVHGEHAENEKTKRLIEMFSKMKEVTSELLDAYSRSMSLKDDKAISLELEKVREKRAAEHKILFENNKADSKSDTIHDIILSGNEPMLKGYTVFIVDSYYEPVVGRYHTIVEVWTPTDKCYYIDVDTVSSMKLGKYEPGKYAEGGAVNGEEKILKILNVYMPPFKYKDIHTAFDSSSQRDMSNGNDAGYIVSFDVTPRVLDAYEFNEDNRLVLRKHVFDYLKENAIGVEEDAIEIDAIDNGPGEKDILIIVRFPRFTVGDKVGFVGWSKTYYPFKDGYYGIVKGIRSEINEGDRQFRYYYVVDIFDKSNKLVKSVEDLFLGDIDSYAAVEKDYETNYEKYAEGGEVKQEFNLVPHKEYGDAGDWDGRITIDGTYDEAVDKAKAMLVDYAWCKEIQISIVGGNRIAKVHHDGNVIKFEDGGEVMDKEREFAIAQEKANWLVYQNYIREISDEEKNEIDRLNEEMEKIADSITGDINWKRIQQIERELEAARNDADYIEWANSDEEEDEYAEGGKVDKSKPRWLKEIESFSSNLKSKGKSLYLLFDLSGSTMDIYCDGKRLTEFIADYIDVFAELNGFCVMSNGASLAVMNLGRLKSKEGKDKFIRFTGMGFDFSNSLGAIFDHSLQEFGEDSPTIVFLSDGYETFPNPMPRNFALVIPDSKVSNLVKAIEDKSFPLKEKNQNIILLPGCKQGVVYAVGGKVLLPYEELILRFFSKHHSSDKISDGKIVSEVMPTNFDSDDIETLRETLVALAKQGKIKKHGVYYYSKNYGQIDLGFYHLGNGVTVCDRNREENRDYKKIAHISEDGTVITYYDKNLPADAVTKIEEEADGQKKLIAKFGSTSNYAEGGKIDLKLSEIAKQHKSGKQYSGAKVEKLGDGKYELKLPVFTLSAEEGSEIAALYDAAGYDLSWGNGAFGGYGGVRSATLTKKVKGQKPLMTYDDLLSNHKDLLKKVKCTPEIEKEYLAVAKKMKASALLKLIKRIKDWPTYKTTYDLNYSINQTNDARESFKPLASKLYRILMSKFKSTKIGNKKIGLLDGRILVDGKALHIKRDSGTVTLEGKGNVGFSPSTGAFYSADAFSGHLQGNRYVREAKAFESAMIDGEKFEDVDKERSKNDKTRMTWQAFKEYIGITKTSSITAE